MRPRQHGAMPLFLPGSLNQQLVRYDVVDGMAVMEGDIMLGPAAQLPLRYGVPRAPVTSRRSAVATADRSHLWPESQIPFVIDGTVGAETRGFIDWAVAHINTTNLKMRPRGDADRDYVVFNASGSGCSSYVGRIGGPQEIQVAGCGRGSVAHEIMHAAGFFHEQSRGDRDDFVTIVWDEIVPEFRSNFEKRDGQAQDIGPYDYASILHYSSRSFSRTGKPTIVTRVPGTSIGQREGLSQHDRAAVAVLYAGGGAQPPPGPTPPPSPPPPAPPGPSAWNGSFAGSYSSARGNVTCTQNGSTVSCQYPGGSMLCAANGSQLDCGWTGGGQGRAVFQRQPTGLLAGTYGDFFSTNSRGSWDLAPSSASPGPTPPVPPAPPPGPLPPSNGPAPLGGSYASTRGPMSCTESPSALSCTFTEAGANGRLDCTKDPTALSLACTWVTFLPRPGTGRAVLSRRSAGERNLGGTWGHFGATSGGGTWEMTGQ